MDHLAKERADDDDFGRRLAKNELNRLFKLSVCLSVCLSARPFIRYPYCVLSLEVSQFLRNRDSRSLLFGESDHWLVLGFGPIPSKESIPFIESWFTIPKFEESAHLY